MFVISAAADATKQEFPSIYFYLYNYTQ